MKSKIALNTFYTLGIVVSVFGIKWAYQGQNYPVLGLLVATALFFLYLKINIVKEVRTNIKEKEQIINNSTPVVDPSAPVKEETN